MKDIIILSIVAILGVAFWAMLIENSNDPSVSPKSTYSSVEQGISFEYPTQYYLEEKEVGNGERKQYNITLTLDTVENKAVREGNAPGREGPTAITVDIYQNNLDKLSAEDFIKNNSNSNYKLGSGVMTSGIKGNVTGIEYMWSGLYEGKSFVISTPERVYMFSVTYLDPTDSIITDYENLTRSVILEQ